VAPVGDEHQYLTRIRRTAEGVSRERFDPVRFVPLVRDAK
jgi:protein-L-isoaspartate O-methyltransferase